MSPIQRSFESHVRSEQAAAGWSDYTLLGIVLDFLTFYCSQTLQREVLDYLAKCKERTMPCCKDG